jgi:hypothetical protein
LYLSNKTSQDLNADASVSNHTAGDRTFHADFLVASR